jgi:hypothetical protein
LWTSFSRTTKPSRSSSPPPNTYKYNTEKSVSRRSKNLRRKNNKNKRKNKNKRNQITRSKANLTFFISGLSKIS